MTRIPRYKFLTVVLAALLTGAVVPYTLHAQGAPGQSSSSSSSSSSKHHKKNKKEAAESSASNASNTASSTENKAETKKETGSKAHETVAAQTPPSPGMVWVNTSSKVYHKSGSRWYGKTKHGKWMSEADAEKAGYKAAKN